MEPKGNHIQKTDELKCESIAECEEKIQKKTKTGRNNRFNNKSS